MATVREAAEQVRPWVERFARFGFAAKSLVYLVASALSGAAALGYAAHATGPTDAVRTLASGPFGRILLVAAAPGLFGYALWRLSQAVTDARGVGHGLLGLIIRIADAVTGFIYAGLGYIVVHELLDPGQKAFSGTGHTLQSILGTTAGSWGVGVVGGIMMANGAVQLYKAVSGIYRKTLRLEEMGKVARGLAEVLGRMAFAAWGVIFGLLGWSVIQAATSHQARQAHGVGGTLREVQATSQGAWDPWPLFLLAAGLLAFALYALLEVRWRKIEAA